HHPSLSPYGLFNCRDGAVQISVGNESLWQRFCAAFDIDPATEGLADNASRVANRPRLIELIEEKFSAFDSDELLAALSEAGIPSALAATLPESYERAQALSQGLTGSGAHPALRDVARPGPPLRFFAAAGGGEAETTRSRHEAPPLRVVSTSPSPEASKNR